jgi:membrane associated rhomboid family serine protease
VIVLLCCAVELTLQLADRGLLGRPSLRALAYEYGAFWPPLLRGWEPNYALQPWTMFASYALLHGGLLHLTFNMVTLWSLGRAVLRTADSGALVGLLLAGTLGGAIAQGVLSTAPNPVVGLSGALFGLVGGLIWDQVRAARTDPAARRTVIGMLGVLVALNVGMWIGFDGRLAWQAHLGGFLAGLALSYGRSGLRG